MEQTNRLGAALRELYARVREEMGQSL